VITIAAKHRQPGRERFCADLHRLVFPIAGPVLITRPARASLQTTEGRCEGERVAPA